MGDIMSVILVTSYSLRVHNFHKFGYGGTDLNISHLLKQKKPHTWTIFQFTICTETKRSARWSAVDVSSKSEALNLQWRNNFSRYFIHKIASYTRWGITEWSGLQYCRTHQQKAQFRVRWYSSTNSSLRDQLQDPEAPSTKRVSFCGNQRSICCLPYLPA